MNKLTVRKAVTELGGVAEAALKLGITRQGVYRWFKHGISRYGVLLIEQALKKKRSRK